jgi:hypothetical protein
VGQLRKFEDASIGDWRNLYDNNRMYIKDAIIFLKDGMQVKLLDNDILEQLEYLVFDDENHLNDY